MKISIPLLFLTLLSISTFAQNQFNSATNALLFMEDAVQRTNAMNTDRGSSFMQEIMGEMAASRMTNQDAKRARLGNVLEAITRIDDATTDVITYLDQLKLTLITQSGVANSSVKNSLIIENANESQPARLNLFKLKEPLNKVEFRDSSELSELLEVFKNEIIQACGTYTYGEKSFTVTTPGEIPFTNSRDYRVQVMEAFGPESLYNFIEDFYILFDLYDHCESAKTQSNWLEDGALLTNLSFITTLQSELLSIRDLALAHWKSKVSTGEFNYNEILPLLNDPDVIEAGKSIEFNVTYGGIDTENRPVIEIISPKNATITYDDNQVGTIKLSNPSVGTHIIKGTITVMNKSGVSRMKEWEKVIEVKAN